MQALGPLLGGSGGSKDNNLISFAWIPMIKIRKNQKNAAALMAKYPEGEYPNPRYPGGIRVEIPAWLVVLLLATGGVAALLYFSDLMGDITKEFGKLTGTAKGEPVKVQDVGTGKAAKKVVQNAGVGNVLLGPVLGGGLAAMGVKIG
jgi:hypothetical protein